MATETELLRARLARLQSATRDLTTAASIDDVIEVVMLALDTAVESPARGLWLHNLDTGQLDLVASVGMKPEPREQFASIPIDADLPAAVAHREGRTVF